jgi:sodium/hydrogen antiporter
VPGDPEVGELLGHWKRDRPREADMDMVAVLIVMTTIFVWSVVSARLVRADLSAPIVFVAAGGTLAVADLIDAPSAPETLTPLVEITLVWVLFSDAARVPVQKLRHDLGQYVRLLALGLPLTILAGWGLATLLFPEYGLWLALIVAAALAPTDAALGVPVVTNPAVPSRIRRLITVESGLNDGIATPVVMLAIAGAATAEGVADASALGDALVELLVGAAVGGVAGGVGGWMLRGARRRGWTAEDFIGIAVLALALVAYAGAVSVEGNGFVAAFCGGMAFGAMAGRRGPTELVFLEQTSGLVSLLVWLAFGAIALPLMWDTVDPTTLLYAVLSLTLVRMVPVALVSLGAGLDRSTVLFIGWFGPRGLASLVFALLALEELGEGADEAVAVIGMTVFLSVLAHGLSAAPLAARYGAATTAHGPEPGARLDLPVRGLPRPPVVSSREGDSDRPVGVLPSQGHRGEGEDDAGR